MNGRIRTFMGFFGVLVLVFFAGQLPAATKVGTSVAAENTGGGNTTLAAPSKNVTGANGLIALINWEGAATLSSVTDSKGNTWTIDHQLTYSLAVPTEPSAAIAYSMNVTGDAALVVTANFSATVTLSGILVQEWSGLASSSPSDGRQTSQGDGNITGPPFATSAITTTTSGIMVAVLGGYELTGTVSATGSSPAATIDTPGTLLTSFREYLISGSGQSITPSGSWTGNHGRWVMLASTFKDTGGGGGGISVPVAVHHYNQQTAD